MRRFIRIARAAALILLLLFLLAGCTPLAYFYSVPLREPATAAPSDVIVLMSSGELDDLWLTPEANQRVMAALFLYRRGFAPAVITSGSSILKGQDQAALEAEWLERAGIPRERIIVENRSTRTYESIREVAALMREHRMITATIVTSEMDILRIRLVARKQGLGFFYLGVPEFPHPRGIVYFPAGFDVLYHASYEYAGLALYRWKAWI